MDDSRVPVFPRESSDTYHPCMKKILAVMTISASLMLAGCASEPKNISDEGKIRVVTSFYPLYEIAKQVGGDLVTVTNLVPAGGEPHDYEPSPHDIIALHEAKLVIINGGGLEIWTDKIIPDLEKSGVQVLNESSSFQLLDGGEESPTDPHIWLDPIQYLAEVNAVAEKLSIIDPTHRSNFEDHAKTFAQHLTTLDQQYIDGLKSCKFQSFVTNHAAFAYLAKRYHLEMIAIAGLSPDAEPSAKTMAELTNTIRKLSIKTILVETLVSSKIAEVLAQEVGATTLVMNPLEGLTNEDIGAGKSYITVMKENLENLRTALECE